MHCLTSVCIKGAGKNASEILLMDDADTAGFGSPVEKNALMIKNKYKQHMKKEENIRSEIKHQHQALVLSAVGSQGFSAA